MRTSLITLSTTMLLAAAAQAQLRVCEWNVTTYGQNAQSQARDPAFQTALYGIVPAPLVYAGKSMMPDVIVGQEFTSAAGVTAFVAMLNSAPGSPGDWAAAGYNPNVAPADTSVGAGAFFYRTSKMQPVTGLSITPVIVSVGVAATNGIPPRNTERFDARLAGYANVEGAVISFYCSHAKSGSAGTDIDKRTTEFTRIATNALTLPASRLFMFCADTNTQNSTQAGYQALVNNAGSPGPFWDPIRSPGSWDNNAGFKFIHTQDPAPSGEMDSRHDQILISNTIRDGIGFEYIGNSNLTFSTSTWNDPNHSYRCWGNDGSGNGSTSPLTIAGNAEVGPAIAQALRDTAAVNPTGGHLPVYADFKVPAKITLSASSINFGTVNTGSTAQLPITVTNSGDTAKWTIAGIANLNYRVTVTGPFTITAPGSVSVPNVEAPGGGNTSHTITMNTTTPGTKNGTLTFLSDAPENPSIVVNLTGVVQTPPACIADLGMQGGIAGQDGLLDNNDFVVFINEFFAGNLIADLGIQGGGPGQDGVLDNNDFVAFINAFFAGCP